MIPLSDVLVALRQELLKAQQQAAQERLKFKVDDIELELKVTTARDLQGGVGVKFWIYNSEVKGKVANEAVQTVRLKLKPDDGSDSFNIANDGVERD